MEDLIGDGDEQIGNWGRFGGKPTASWLLCGGFGGSGLLLAPTGVCT